MTAHPEGFYSAPVHWNPESLIQVVILGTLFVILAGVLFLLVKAGE